MDENLTTSRRNKLTERIMKYTHPEVGQFCPLTHPPPCSLKRHYGTVGSIMLGKRIAFAVKEVLEKRRQSGTGDLPLPKKIIDLSQNSTQCFLPGTSCPTGYTCMTNIVARAGFGCCHLKDGIDCGDSWHCCPKGTTCHPGCTDTQCSCITSDPS